MPITFTGDIGSNPKLRLWFCIQRGLFNPVSTCCWTFLLQVLLLKMNYTYTQLHHFLIIYSIKFLNEFGVCMSAWMCLYMFCVCVCIGKIFFVNLEGENETENMVEISFLQIFFFCFIYFIFFSFGGEEGLQ